MIRLEGMFFSLFNHRNVKHVKIKRIINLHHPALISINIWPILGKMVFTDLLYFCSFSISLVPIVRSDLTLWHTVMLDTANFFVPVSPGAICRCPKGVGGIITKALCPQMVLQGCDAPGCSWLQRETAWSGWKITGLESTGFQSVLLLL